MRAALRLLWPYTRGRRAAFAGGMAGTLLVTAAELAKPFPLKLVIDHVVADGLTFRAEPSTVAALGALVVLIAVGGAAGTYLAETGMRRLGEHVVHDLRVALYAHLQRLSLRFHRRRHPGDLVTRLTGDVHAVGELVSETLVKVAGAVLLLVGMLVVSTALDPVLTAAAVAITPVLAAATVRSRRQVKAAARRQRAAEGDIAAMSTEALSAIGTVQALGAEPDEEARLRRRSEERRDASLAGTTTEGRFGGLVDVLEAVGTALVLGLGALRIAAGAMTPGDLIVVHSYVRRLYRPVRELARQTGRIARAVTRADRIGEVLAADDTLAEAADAHTGPRAGGDVELRAVRFGYGAGRRPALDGVSLQVPAGTTLAVVGASGAGKSTMASLLARFQDPDEGRVALDGRDLRACALRWVRDQVGFVLQETALFSGTVAENIAFGRLATRSQVEAAATAAGADGFIRALPSGYDTDLGPGGASLSGGQRQRLAIARVLLRDPAVVVLDEPTSGLDAASEREVVDSLERVLRGRTTIVITHSLALARRADRVAVLDRGRVVEEGDPQALLGGGGPFRRLAAQQGLVAAPPVPPPPDPALSRLRELLDPGAVAEILDRSAPGAPAVRDVGIRYIRYKPGTNAVVDYEVDTEAGRRRAVLMVAADRDLSKRASRPANVALADRVDDRGLAGRRPGGGAGRRPGGGARPSLAYVADGRYLVQWLPVDVWLPSLAVPPAELASAAGVILPEGAAHHLLAYKPRRRAVIRVDGHVLKLYADAPAYRAAARALLVGRRLSIRTPPPAGMSTPHQVTVQPVVDGDPIADVRAYAEQAGAAVAPLHRAAVPSSLPALDPLAGAVASAGTVAALLPGQRARLGRLTARLAATRPSPPLVVSHGDYHSRQLLGDAAGTTILDLDEMGLAPAAVDLATYAAHSLDGADLEDGVVAVEEVLEALVAGYGGRPEGLRWHAAVAVLRRSVFPFRTAPTAGWPDGVAAMVGVAEELVR